MKIGEMLVGALIVDWFMSHVKKGPEPPPPPPPPKAPAASLTTVPGDWIYPLPAIRIGGVRYLPTISDGYGWHRRDSAGNPRLHAGADLCYQVRRRTENWGFQPPRELSTGGQFFAPPNLPVFAAQGGTVWRVSTGATGIGVHVVHQSGLFGTLYLHLESVVVKRGAKVGAGQALGTWGYDPSNKTIRHLHFQAGPFDKARGEFAWADPKALLARCTVPVTVDVKAPVVVS